jgi:hypothetical protein
VSGKASRFGMVSIFREKAGEAAQKGDAPDAGIKRGGKSSNAAFEKTTMYLEKEMKLNVQRRLLGTDEDMSSLVNRLLSEWLDV